LDFSKKEEAIQSNFLYKKSKLANELGCEILLELLAYFIKCHSPADYDVNEILGMNSDLNESEKKRINLLVAHDELIL